MLRRKAKREEAESVSAFVDRQGARKRPRQKRQAQLSTESDETGERLESLVFGKQPFQPAPAPAPAAARSSSSEESDGEVSDDVEGSGDGEGRSRDEAHRPVFTEEPSEVLQRQPAWQDEDDQEISVDISAHHRLRKLRKTETETAISGTTYSQRLRTQFEKLSSQPEWAKAASRKKKKKKRRSQVLDSEESSSESEEEGEGLLQRTGDLLARQGERLPQGSIDIQRMKDANATKRALAVVQSVEFHPSSNVLLTAGFHKTLDIFQVDGQANPLLQSVHVERFPILCAHFTADGREVVMAGHRRSFFVYDMVAGKITRVKGIRGRDDNFYDKFVVSPDNKLLVFLGKDGYLPLVSNKTKQWVANLKMNGDVYDVAFTPDSRHLLSAGSDGRVYVWDLSTRSCVHCFTDEGCVRATTLAVSPDSSYVACGSGSGVVNIYGSDCLRQDGPKPLKAVMNLTTGVNHACFNSTSEILAISSRSKKDALKLVHLPSMTVFSNWPTAKTHLSHVSAIDLSPQSRYLTVGNDKGKALLYRLNHYYKGM